MNHPPVLSAFHIPAAPAELMAIINARRALIPADATMSAAASEGQAAPQGTDAAPQAPAVPAAPPAAPAAPPASQAPDSGEVSSLPDWAQKMIRDANAEAAKSRTTAKQNAVNEAMAEIGKKLGFVQGDEKVTPEHLTEQLTAERAKTRMLELRDTIREAMPNEAVRLLKTTDFLDAIKGLEPTDVDGIKKAAEATLAANPWLRSTPAVAKSGAELSGGTGEKQAKPKSLAEAISKAYGA